MIYTYLWTYEITDCSLSRMFDIFRTGFRQCTINNLKRLKKGPFFTNPVFVGQVTALEVVEVFYRIAVPGFHIRKPEDLKTILFKDPFNVGYDATRMLRSLVLECKIDRYRTLPMRSRCVIGPLGMNCNHTASERTYIRGDELRQAFSPLLSIQDKVKRPRRY